MIRVGIVGGTGYTGSELIRLLLAHPKVELTVLTSRGEAGRMASDVFSSLQGVCDLVFCEPSLEVLGECDVVFFATPHGVAMNMAAKLLSQGIKIIDLGADFRLQSTDEFAKWYAMEHTSTDVLAQAVYGLTEVMRDKIKTASVVANPGCYPTTALLGLKPIIDTQNTSDTPLIDSKIIIDAKSGVSGAGRQAKVSLGFGQVSENFLAYGVLGHRHTPEIMQGVHQILGSRYRHSIRFVPHLVPMSRGMLSTIHIGLTSEGQQRDWHRIFEQTYREEYFIDVLPKGMFPETQSVRASNRLKIAAHQEEDVLTVIVVQDNLVKGASGQAIQNMNVMFGLDERLGIDGIPVTP